mmetsp:Transcript_91706/g.168158  ORF Transcript_91706/g.168158 Transcript_91706/m.168158 type:complete len:256 (-) Transcript_91706:152-919(-)
MFAPVSGHRTSEDLLAMKLGSDGCKAFWSCTRPAKSTACPSCELLYISKKWSSSSPTPGSSRPRSASKTAACSIALRSCPAVRNLSHKLSTAAGANMAPCFCSVPANMSMRPYVLRRPRARSAMPLRRAQCFTTRPKIRKDGLQSPSVLRSAEFRIPSQLFRVMSQRVSPPLLSSFKTGGAPRRLEQKISLQRAANFSRCGPHVTTSLPRSLSADVSPMVSSRDRNSPIVQRLMSSAVSPWGARTQVISRSEDAV